MSTLSNTLNGYLYIVPNNGNVYDAVHLYTNPLVITPTGVVDASASYDGSSAIAGFGAGGSSLTNYGTIIGQGAPGGFIGNGVSLPVSGSTLMNQGGSITGGQDLAGYNAGAGVSLDGGTLENNVVSPYRGGYANTPGIHIGTITGGSSVSASGGVGVSMTDGGTLNNGSSIPVNFTTTYQAVIRGGASSSGNGGNGVSFSGSGSITNSGTINGGDSKSGTAGTGVSENGQTYVVNQGAMYGGTSTQGTGGVGVVLVNDFYINPGGTNAGNITNTSLIHGGDGATGGVGLVLNNSNAYNDASPGTEVLIAGGSATAGHAGGTGVVLENASYLTNSATIEGGNGMTTGGGGGTGVEVDSGSHLVNNAVISAGNVASGQSLGVGVIINGGTVYTGGSGGIFGSEVYNSTDQTFTFGDSVQFGTGNSKLFLEASTGAGAKLYGDIGGFQIGDSIYISGNVAQKTGVAHYASTYNVATPEGTLQFNGSFAGEHFVVAPGTGNETGFTEVSLAEGAACYARGTLIATAMGDVPIEHLCRGDSIRTLDGQFKPIQWIGRRHYTAALAAGTPDFLPIVIRAGALAAGIPRRDLKVSPGHALYIDGLLIPASDLVNGVSIVQENLAQEIHYYHLEFDTHVIIFAEGAPAESFVDDDSRQLFDNAAEYASLDSFRQPAKVRFCAPRVEEGWALEALRQRLAARVGCGTLNALRVVSTARSSLNVCGAR